MTGKVNPKVTIYKQYGQGVGREFRCDIDVGPGHHGEGESPSKALLRASFAWHRHYSMGKNG